MLQIILNGEAREVGREISLQELLTEFSLPSERIAIELNREVVRKKDWGDIKIKHDDRIEVVHFVGGG